MKGSSGQSSASFPPFDLRKGRVSMPVGFHTLLATARAALVASDRRIGLKVGSVIGPLTFTVAATLSRLGSRGLGVSRSWNLFAARSTSPPAASILSTPQLTAGADA